MARIIRLTERDLTRIVKRVINEQLTTSLGSSTVSAPKPGKRILAKEIIIGKSYRLRSSDNVNYGEVIFRKKIGEFNGKICFSATVNGKEVFEPCFDTKNVFCYMTDHVHEPRCVYVFES